MDVLFGDGAAWFTVPALIGSAVFLVRLVMMILGGGFGDMFGDSAGSTGDAHGDASDAFKFLSIQGFFVFLMGFGWGAFAAFRGSGFSRATSILVGLLVGFVLVAMLGFLFRGMRRLESSGNIDARALLDREGEVYLTVPGRQQGRGQVRVTIEDRQRIYNAITPGEDLVPGTRVKVTEVNGDNSLTVLRVL